MDKKPASQNMIVEATKDTRNSNSQSWGEGRAKQIPLAVVQCRSSPFFGGQAPQNGRVFLRGPPHNKKSSCFFGFPLETEQGAGVPAQAKDCPGPLYLLLALL